MNNAQYFYKKRYVLEEGDLSENAKDICEFAEEYAKQEAIGFLIWNAGKIFEYVDWFKNKKQLSPSSEEEYAKDCEITAFELSTIEKRYQLYQQYLKTLTP